MKVLPESFKSLLVGSLIPFTAARLGVALNALREKLVIAWVGLLAHVVVYACLECWIFEK